MTPEAENLYKAHSKYVYSNALRLLRNKQDAEDVTQNVFIKFFAALSSFRGDSSVRTYLYRIAVNEIMDMSRKRKVRENKMEQVASPEYTKPQTGKMELDSLLSKLDDEHKIPILLSEINGFTYKEIAEILNLNEGTVKSRIHRGMAKLIAAAQKEKTK
ncbi:MAG: RNA polymerase sigma factor [bacterium]